MVFYAQGIAANRPKGAFFKTVIISLLFSLLACFSANTLIGFYICFEARALAVFIYIIGFGYQPERAVARIFLIVFTLASSLPLFAIILTM
jgi:formate hydrogenlyase subunit 3/multisubunit Na+/H+ antiporter MnhD subunit